MKVTSTQMRCVNSFETKKKLWIAEYENFLLSWKFFSSKKKISSNVDGNFLQKSNNRILSVLQNNLETGSTVNWLLQMHNRILKNQRTRKFSFGFGYFVEENKQKRDEDYY